MHTRFTAICLFASVLLATGCPAPQPTASVEPEPNVTRKRLLASDFDSRLLEIASNYEQFPQVSTQASLAPTACRIAFTAIRLSQADDPSQHARKLYFLFCNNLLAYRTAASEASPVGQTIVKQSWKAHSMGADERQALVELRTKDGQWSRGSQKELFIMHKLEPDTPGTDNGWLYGVVTADGQRVLERGCIENCMSCHETAGVDRLFGVK